MALAALIQSDPDAKCDATLALWAQRDALACDPSEALSFEGTLPGRPGRPLLVTHTQVPRRSPHTPEGRAALMHAICHIEFNAINLALDAIWRFDGMPLAYYWDWLLVAQEEAQHFRMVREHLRRLGHDYGSFEAHQGLWQMCDRTAQDVTARMALVPRTLEARGLDATPPIQDKLRQVGDHEAVAILDVILRDEVGHVRIGNHWYLFRCQMEGLDPISHYDYLTALHEAPKPRPPLNLSAREAAGFTPEELAKLMASTKAA